MSGRPREYGDRLSTGLRLPRELHDRLTAAASERDVSVNWLVNRAVADFLDRLVPVDEIILTRDPVPRCVDGSRVHDFEGRAVCRCGYRGVQGRAS